VLTHYTACGDGYLYVRVGVLIPLVSTREKWVMSFLTGFRSAAGGAAAAHHPCTHFMLMLLHE
jgi:hypothetical protein